MSCRVFSLRFFRASIAFLVSVFFFCSSTERFSSSAKWSRCLLRNIWAASRFFKMRLWRLSSLLSDDESVPAFSLRSSAGLMSSSTCRSCRRLRVPPASPSPSASAQRKNEENEENEKRKERKTARKPTRRKGLSGLLCDHRTRLVPPSSSSYGTSSSSSPLMRNSSSSPLDTDLRRDRRLIDCV